MAELQYLNNAQIVDEDTTESVEKVYYEPTEADKKLVKFVMNHIENWREYRDQNYLDNWNKQERIWKGEWAAEDKEKSSERSKLVSPATQQAIETKHAEMMEATFGQGEFFDIKDDIADGQKVDVELIKAQLNEDFAQDKIRKSIDQIVLLSEIFDIGIGEIVVQEKKVYTPSEQPLPLQPGMVAIGAMEGTRTSVGLNPVNPKNFLFDPNGVDIDDCMGCAIEKYVSMHKIVQGVESGRYLKIDIESTFNEQNKEDLQETTPYDKDRVLLLTYYGLVPREYLIGEEVEELFDEDDELEDMVEAIVVIANDGTLLKREESPYMMKDRPIVTFQPDTVPNRLIGRGIANKARNMQAAIDGSMRAHMDSLAYTVAPMMAADATRLPRGMKLEVKAGKSLLVNGDPNAIFMPFKFGQTDGSAMETSKEFERMLLMATGTVDSAGQVSKVGRDTNMDMATATLIKKYKRTLTNFQEDFLIPFVNKAAWRYMQFAPQRYKSVDVKFIPTGVLGILAREHEQKQLAFLMQTFGADSPMTPILMQAILSNSSLPEREKMIDDLKKSMQPNPEKQAFNQQMAQKQLAKEDAEINKLNAQAELAAKQAESEPLVAKARIIAALSNNLNEDNEGADFERRARIADLLLKEKEIDSNHDIARMQTIASMSKNSNSGATQ